jgi:hypothetical protein
VVVALPGATEPPVCARADADPPARTAIASAAGMAILLLHPDRNLRNTTSSVGLRG